MYNSDVQFSCTNPMYKSDVHIRCTIRMYNFDVQVRCTNPTYKSDVQFRYTNPIYILDYKSDDKLSVSNGSNVILTKSIKSSVRDFSSPGSPDRTVPLGPTNKRRRVRLNAFFFNIILFEFYSFSFE